MAERRGGTSRLLLALAFMGTGLSACSSPEPPTEAERADIQRAVVVEDLTAGSKTESIQVTVPPDSFVRLQGRAWVTDAYRDTGEVGPVTFSLEADSERLFERTLEKRGRTARFHAEIPVEESAEGEVEFRLAIDRENPEEDMGIWHRVTLEQLQTVSRRPADAGPNVLLLIVDTWRADRMGLYGGERPTTPFLDAFAEKGKVFENAISQASWTAPAVASVLTGRYPIHHGVIHGEPLHHRNETLAEVFQDAGFTTMAISTNPLLGPHDGYMQGFETFEHIPKIRGHHGDEIFGFFENWIEENRNHQWFAYLHFMDPHDPYEAPEPYANRFTDPDYDGLFVAPKALNEVFRTVNFGEPSPHIYTEEDIDYLEAAYDEEVLSWDQQLRKIIELLEDEGMLEDTIIAVTSDHGEEFIDHGFFKHGSHLYEESVRVPLVLYAPGQVSPGRTSEVVETRGIFDALVELAGLAPEGARPAQLLAESAGKPRPAFSHVKYQPKPGIARRPEIASVRDGRWKYIQWNSPPRSELYDLDADPREQKDVSAEHPRKIAQYREMVNGWLATKTAIRDSDPPPDEELEKRLRALGYIE